MRGLLGGHGEIGVIAGLFLFIFAFFLFPCRICEGLVGPIKPGRIRDTALVGLKKAVGFRSSSLFFLYFSGGYGLVTLATGKTFGTLRRRRCGLWVIAICVGCVWSLSEVQSGHHETSLGVFFLSGLLSWN